MRLSEVADELGLELIVGEADRSFTGGYTSDLLSDVMANAEEGDALITIQAHNNTVAVASHVESPVIIICNARPIPDSMTDAAREHDVAVCRTAMNQFEVSGRLYARLR